MNNNNREHTPYGPYEKYFKRPMDCLVSGSAIIILSPVMLIVALLVRFNLGSPIIFFQERPGLNERIFKLYKFRTMTDGKDADGELLPDTVRLTAFGKLLRSSSLDELPELFNILKGDMSLIGPRPLLTRYLPAYTDVEKHRHDVRPGLSGLAQVNGRNFAPWDERLAYDVEYVNKITFVGDLKLVLKTVANVIKHKDVATNTEEIDEGFLDEIRNINRGE